MSDKLVDLGCAPLELFCSGAMEPVANVIAEIITAFAGFALGESGFGATGNLLTTAAGQANMWLGLAVVVMLITAVVGIAGGAVIGRADLLKRTLLGMLLSFPATVFALFVVGEGLRVTDEVSAALLQRLAGAEGFAAMITTLFSPASTNTNSTVVGVVAPGSLAGQAIATLLLLGIGVLFLTVAMAFRDFVILLLIAFAPLAFILLPAKGGEVWVKRWASAVTASILAKPLMLGALLLVTAGIGNLESIWSPSTITLEIGFVIVSFLPLMAYSFFNFMGGTAAAAGDEVGRRAAGTTTQGVSRATNTFTRRFSGGGGFSAPRGKAPNHNSGAAPSTHQTAGRSQTSNQQAASGGRPGAGPGSGKVLQPDTAAPPAAPSPSAPPAAPPAHRAPASTPPAAPAPRPQAPKGPGG